jgi:hypothetical protein
MMARFAKGEWKSMRVIEPPLDEELMGATTAG